MFRNHVLAILAGMFVSVGAKQMAQGALAATFVEPAFTTLSAAGGGAEFASASTTLFVDPAITRWIAWNDTPTVSLTHPARPGELFLGPGGIGVDDYLRLTV